MSKYYYKVQHEQAQLKQKHMNKAILRGLMIAAATIGVLITINFLVGSKPAIPPKSAYTNEQLQQLYKLGFTNANELNASDQFDYAIHPDRIKFYYDTY